MYIYKIKKPKTKIKKIKNKKNSKRHLFSWGAAYRWELFKHSKECFFVGIKKIDFFISKI
jgi:hypothetical protein